MAHFQDALTFCRSAGYRPELGWTCYFYVGTLLPRNGEVVRARATSLLDEVPGNLPCVGHAPLDGAGPVASGTWNNSGPVQQCGRISLPQNIE